MLDLDQPAPDHRKDALHIVFQRGKLVMDMRSREPCILTDTDLAQNRWEVAREHYIGHWSGQACFAVEIRDICDVDAMRYQAGSLYQLLGRVDDGVFALAGRAAQLLDWQRDHRFCGRCGQQMQIADGERAMACGSCKTLLYPRISPCVIMLITRGDEMLLARNARFPRPMYSSLAGFIEAGESAEDTLRREVREEVGVEVAEIEYFGSQSWPFPNQLMLGYFAEYASGDITPDLDEIAEANWYHPNDLPPVPPPSSIAGQLIQYHCRRVQSR
ncbi:NAD(+) diphosphatase [Congregibacter sp.]|uniref:NAD(+) diphosphatase n=1 Tax=Congregibacter sp. TaxID=2744308 RepID=UPI003F6C2494